MDVTGEVPERGGGQAEWERMGGDGRWGISGVGCKRAISAVGSEAQLATRAPNAHRHPFHYCVQNR